SPLRERLQPLVDETALELMPTGYSA
ncbi:MAG: HNH endonuclease, partial [Spiribacter salinus]